jgi:hypothetical protein
MNNLQAYFILILEGLVLEGRSQHEFMAELMARDPASIAMPMRKSATGGVPDAA